MNMETTENCPTCGAETYTTGEVMTVRVCDDNPTHVFYSHN